MTNQITKNPVELLKKAPGAINSYNPGHWDFMLSLESRAKEIVNQRDVEKAVSFLADVAFLKQPHRINRNNLINILSNHLDSIRCCLLKLQDIDRLDYEVLEYVAKIPYFGRRGGRSFASALLRLLRPDKYGIIDWRNMAVLAGAQGFDGLISPPFEFTKVTAPQIFKEKGHLLYSPDLYIEYNDILRKLASEYGKSPADVDLILWVYSIEQLPFPSFTTSEAIFDSFTQSLRNSSRNMDRRTLTVTVNNYIDQLQSIGNVSEQLVRAELKAIFKFILDEFLLFSENHRNAKHKVTILRIRRTLEEAINSEEGEWLLAKWETWENRVDPSSPSYTGHTNLPGSMVIEGYIILEDLIPIRKYIENKYCDSSFLSKED